MTAPTPAPASSLSLANVPVGVAGAATMVELGRIQPCSFQPRKDFAPEALQELADSIREQGIVQPLIVRRAGDHFELIAGERRWRAAQLAGLTRAPVVVRDADDRTVLELALVENLQRENLNPMEESRGYAQLIEQFTLTQEEAAAKVGKSRAAARPKYQGGAAAPPYLSRAAGFCLPGGATRAVRGRLLLAWMPEAFKHAGEQPGVLDEEVDGQQGARPAGDARPAARRLARAADWGA